MSVKTSKLNKKEIVFWDVDTQKDFMEKGRPLYVNELDKKNIRPVLKQLTDFAIKNRIQRCYTLDTHNAKDWKGEALAEEMQIFPPHTIIGTEGFRKIAETNRRSNCVIRKSTYDVFNEKQKMKKVINTFREKGKTTIVIYGVATDYCVKSAVIGFLYRNFKVIVISNAIAGVKQASIRCAIREMKSAGATFKTFNEFKKMIK